MTDLEKDKGGLGYMPVHYWDKKRGRNARKQKSCNPREYETGGEGLTSIKTKTRTKQAELT